MVKATVRGSRLSYYSSVLMMLLGIITFLFVDWRLGIVLIVVGFVMYRFYRRQRSSKALAGNLRGKGSVELGTGPSGSGPNVVKEKEIHVVVRIPCRFCGVLNDQLRTKCESCGAPLK